MGQAAQLRLDLSPQPSAKFASGNLFFSSIGTAGPSKRRQLVFSWSETNVFYHEDIDFYLNELNGVHLGRKWRGRSERHYRITGL